MDQANSQNEFLEFQQDFSKLEQAQARLQKIRQPQMKCMRVRIEDLLNKLLSGRRREVVGGQR
jgi:hypothetical protein